MNVFLITIDSLRASDVGCIGGNDLTPNIDSFSKHAMVYSQAFSNGPGTIQSFPSIFYSIYPFMCNGLVMSKKNSSLSETLLKNGYNTAGVHSNPYLSQFFGWDRGFDLYLDLHEDRNTISKLHRKIIQTKDENIFSNYMKKLVNNNKTKYIIKKITSIFRSDLSFYTKGEDISRKGIEIIKKHRNGDDDLFLWLHYMDPHEPYVPPQDYVTSYNEKEIKKINIEYFTKKGKENSLEILKDIRYLYQMEVKYVDHCIGKILDFLSMSEILEDTVVVITADHGEAFYEHDIRGHPFYSLYDEGLHVPLIIYKNNQKGRNDYLQQLLDLSPSILSYLNIDRPYTYLGRDFNDDVNKCIISESPDIDLNNYTFDFNRKIASCRTNKWKYIYNEFANHYELYDLVNDEEERTNTIDENKDIADGFHKILLDHIKYCQILRN